MESFDPTVPSEPSETEKHLQDVLFRDFYLSFKFSQGSPYTQAAILDCLAGYYRDYSPYSKEELLLALESIEKRVEKIAPPTKHTTEITDENIAVNILLDFNRLTTAITMNDSISSYELQSLLNLMIERDMNYQIYERPNRKPGEDKHASFVREYVVQSRNPHSDALNKIFHLIKDRMPQQQYSMELTNLVQAWEENHPGQKFFPSEQTT